MPRSKPPVLIGRLPNGFPFYLTEADGNCLFRALAVHVYSSQDEHLRVRYEITLEVTTNWEKYAEFCAHDDNAAAYSVRMREQKDYGDYIEIIAAERIYNSPCYVWDQATPDSPFEPSHGCNLAGRDPDDPPHVSSDGPFPDDAMLLAHSQAEQHYSFVLLPDHAAALEGLASGMLSPGSPSQPLLPNPKNLRRKRARQRAFLRSKKANNNISGVEEVESVDTERTQILTLHGRAYYRLFDRIPTWRVVQRKFLGLGRALSENARSTIGSAKGAGRGIFMTSGRAVCMTSHIMKTPSFRLMMMILRDAADDRRRHL